PHRTTRRTSVCAWMADRQRFHAGGAVRRTACRLARGAQDRRARARLGPRLGRRGEVRRPRRHSRLSHERRSYGKRYRSIGGRVKQCPPAGNVNTESASEIEHDAFRVRDVAERRLVRTAVELWSPVEIAAAQAGNWTVRVDEDESDAAAQQVAAQRSGELHEVVDASRIRQHDEGQWDRTPSGPAALAKHERMLVARLAARDADAPIARVVSEQLDLERREPCV